MSLSSAIKEMNDSSTKVTTEDTIHQERSQKIYCGEQLCSGRGMNQMTKRKFTRNTRNEILLLFSTTGT